jgi:hypothetical protein
MYHTVIWKSVIPNSRCHIYCAFHKCIDKYRSIIPVDVLTQPASPERRKDIDVSLIILDNLQLHVSADCHSM